jgi:hypothetical protein
LTTRRLTSRKVALTAAFLALAAGGTAACDNTSDWESDPSGYDFDSSGGGSYNDSSGLSSGGGSYDDGSYDDGSDDDGSYDDSEDEPEPSDEVFYCADPDGMIVEEDLCAGDDSGTSYLLWHSASYDRGLSAGDMLDGGNHFKSSDRKARAAFKLPSTGTVRNGTIKTNVVGKGSGTGSSGSGTSGG